MPQPSDDKNHTRLGGKNGGWEDVFRTTSPWHKYFSGLIRMIETNAYYAYTYFNQDKERRT